MGIRFSLPKKGINVEDLSDRIKNAFPNQDQDKVDIDKEMSLITQDSGQIEIKKTDERGESRFSPLASGLEEDLNKIIKYIK